MEGLDVLGIMLQNVSVVVLYCILNTINKELKGIKRRSYKAIKKAAKIRKRRTMILHFLQYLLLATIVSCIGILAKVLIATWVEAIKILDDVS